MKKNIKGIICETKKKMICIFRTVTKMMLTLKVGYTKSHQATTYRF